MTGFTSSITIASPIIPYIVDKYGRMIPKPSSPIKILELGMIRCVVKVCAKDVDHKKYNSKGPYFYGSIIPRGTILF